MDLPKATAIGVFNDAMRSNTGGEAIKALNVQVETENVVGGLLGDEMIRIID